MSNKYYIPNSKKVVMLIPATNVFQCILCTINCWEFICIAGGIDTINKGTILFFFLLQLGN